MVHRRLVCREHLAVVVAAALELPPDVLVGPVLDHLAGAGVAAEEEVADVLAVVGAEGLVVAVVGGVHGVDERAVPVLGQQRVPAAAPHDLDDVPARPAEERLELLDDLAVAADRAVEPLQVAVDDEGEVVELLAGGELQQAAGLGLVHLAVAEERPDVLLAGVLDATVVQVLVELGLVDGVHRADAHRHRRELPEVRHQAGVRVGRQGQRLTGHDVALLLTEAVELVLGEPALEEGAGVHAGGGVSLEEDLVAAARVVGTAPEVVEADFVEGRRGGVGGDVATDADAGRLGAVHHDTGVPAQVGAVAALDLLVAGEPRLGLGRDGVDVVGRRQRRHPDLHLTGALEQLEHDVARALAAAFLDDSVEGVEPLLGLLGIDVRELAGDAVENRSGFLACDHGRESFLAPVLTRVAGLPATSSSIFHPRESQVTTGSGYWPVSGACAGYISRAPSRSTPA